MKEEDREKIVAPNLFFDDSSSEELAEIVASSLESLLSEEKEFICDQYLESLKYFRSCQKEWKNIGQNIIKSHERKLKIMLLGRPYSVFDKQINLGIPAKLENMGFELLYQSMVELSEPESPVTSKFMEKMHWFYGQEILNAAELAAKSDDIYPVFLSCFRCSPDSYLLTYVKEIFKYYNKPYLVVQLDEHTSDVGYLTRIEAAVDTFRSHFKKSVTSKIEIIKSYPSKPFAEGDTVLVPFVSDIISNLQAEAFAAHGFHSAVVRLEKGMINRGYRYASGGECMPNVAIIGSVMEYIERENLDPQKCTVYLPGLCMSCNFHQYSVLFDNACENSEFQGLKIYNGNIIQKIDGVSRELNLNIMEVGIVGSLLYKLYFRFAPYEITIGSVKKVLNQSIKLISKTLICHSSLHDAVKDIRLLFESLNVPGHPGVSGPLSDFFVGVSAVSAVSGVVVETISSNGDTFCMRCRNIIFLHNINNKMNVRKIYKNLNPSNPADIIIGLAFHTPK